MNMDAYLVNSDKIETDDLDWNEAKRIGLSPDEVFTLTYFSDIENQTFVYLRTLIDMKTALEADTMAFLTVWNYEEFFHGKILAHLLKVCGHSLDDNRVANVHGGSNFKERFEAFLTPIVSKIFSNQFPAVYLSFGAIQELTTLRGYERIRETTKNPVLRALCDRIAKQERRHFAWYFNKAKMRLEASKGSRNMTRFLMKRFWVPVGAGVKTPDEVFRLFSILFPSENGTKLVKDVDSKIASLPGLDGLRLMEGYFTKAQSRRVPLLEATAG